MTISRYLTLVALCAIVYFGSYILPDIDGPFYYVMQAAWSLALISVIFCVGTSQTVFLVASVESLFIVLQLFSCVGYLTDFEYFYNHYAIFINGLNIAELIILIMGAPIDAVAVRGVCNIVVDRFSIRLGRMAHSNLPPVQDGES